MYFNPPTPGNNASNPFWHPLNPRMNEELKSIDKKVALDVYNKLKKGDRVEVLFDNAIRKGSKPFELVVTSPHRIVGRSKVGRIILINPENPRGMKYKLFNRDGNVSLAQGDMGTLLKDLKIVKEDVQLDEATNTRVVIDLNDAGNRARAVYRKMESEIAGLDGYTESEFDRAKNFATFQFDAKKHDVTERKKVAEIIKKTKGAEFHHSMTEETEVAEELKSLFDVKPTSKDWMKGKLRTSYNQTNKGVTKEVMKKGQVIDLHPFDGDRFVGSPDRKDKGKYFFIAKYNVDAMKEEVELDESVTPNFDNRLLRQALVLGKNAFKAGKKRVPIKDPNLVSLKGFAKGKDKNEVMRQWLKGWDEMNLKDDVQIDEREKTEYIMKKKGSNKYSILRQTKSGPIGMFHDLDKKAAENIMKRLEGAADASDRRERGIPDVKGKYAGQRLFASYEGEEDNEKIDESTPAYRKMLKDYEKSDDKKVFDILKKNGYRLGEQGDTLVRNMLKKFKGDIKKAAAFIMKQYPGMKNEEVELDEMSAKAHYNKMKAQGKVGGQVVSPIDRERFPNREREGLEGPYRVKKSGLIYYYDKKAGKYYDPQADMYLEVRDIMESSELEEMKRPMGIPGKMPMKGKFTDDQIDKLRDAYGKIGKVDPTSQTYKNLTDYLDNLPDQVIKQLATIKPRVPFISGLALNRMIKRGIK